METSLESVPEIIECHGHCSGSGCWPNISGVKFTGTVDGPFELNKYSYTFNNLWNKKVTFRLQLNGREFEYLDSFSIVKIRKMNQKLER
jgi:hypothetical protein